MRYPDCTGPGGDCAACSLSNYDKDCHSNPVNIVAYHRKRLGLTQKGLAAIIQKPYQWVQKAEHGQIDLGGMMLRNAVPLAKALGIEPEELLNG